MYKTQTYMGKVIITRSEYDPDFQNEYYKKNIAKFQGIEGNQPYKLNANKKLYNYSFDDRQRYFLHALKFGKADFKNNYIFDSLRFVNFRTNDMLLVPIDFFVRYGIKKSHRCQTGQMEERIFTSPIHTHLNKIYKNVVPYISVREILEEAAKLISCKHVYFKFHPGLYLKDSYNSYNSPCTLCKSTFDQSINNIYRNCRWGIYECTFVNIES